jgi:hypothetical protein
MEHRASIGCSGRRTDVRAWGFTCESMSVVRATEGAIATVEVASLSTDELIAELNTPAEPRRMTKPARAAHEARRNAVTMALEDRGISPDSVRVWE